MKRVIIDGACVSDAARLHEMLSFTLAFPEWYGGNLDALYDCLTGELTEETVIVLRNQELLKERLGRRGSGLIRVLKDAAEENSRLTIVAE